MDRTGKSQRIDGPNQRTRRNEYVIEKQGCGYLRSWRCDRRRSPVLLRRKELRFFLPGVGVRHWKRSCNYRDSRQLGHFLKISLIAGSSDVLREGGMGVN